MNMKNKLIAGLLSLTTAFSVVDAAIWASAGMNDNGGIGIEFTSNAGSPNIASLLSVTILLDGDTVFDTDINAPGTAYRPWSVIDSSGPTVTLPSSASTDGNDVAAISFGSFTPGNSVNIDFDIDSPSGVDNTPSPVNTEILFNFLDTDTSGIVTISRTVQPVSTVTIGSDSYSYQAAIPEPGTLMMAGILLGSFGGLALLRRR